jgi:predicted NAD-dependent protein-ADP-ribosyltransferase YbiA (DUF1768 family)
MKYWKEKENNPVENMQFWTGTYITKLAENEIFLYGSNPQGINGAGAAKAAMSLSKGAKHGVGRRFNGSNAYALVTKSLNAGFLEKSTGILYDKEGYCSVSPEQIRTNIDELYEIAKSPEHKDKKFLVSYQYESWPNGTPKKSLNGYTSQEMLEMFAADKDIPPNIVFHDSYKPHLEKLFKKENKQSSGDLVVYENDKTIDIKEEDIVWTIDSDESYVQARHFAGAAKAALVFGAVPINVKQNKPGIARGLSPNNKTFALITKSLEAGYTEPETGITYHKEGFQSVSPEQIRANVDELYETAKKPEHLDKKFLVTYQYEAWPNGTPKKSLNGYTSQEMLEMFAKDKEIPPNIIFHETYKPHLEKLFKKENKQSNGDLVVYENDKTIDIKEDIKQIMQTENKPKEYTFFFHLTSPFSNFHPAKFEYKDLTFISNEQFMMYSKAKTFGDEATAQKIIAINQDQIAKDFLEGKYSREDIVNDKELSAQWQNLMMKAKKLGRGVQNYNEEVWNKRRSKVVLFGARLKFTQNLDLKQILVNTGDTYMIEASRFDPLSPMYLVIQKLIEEFKAENKAQSKIKP